MDIYIDLIIELANKSLETNDIPVGAIVIYNGIIIGKGYNTRHASHSVIGHAEINAIQEAEKKLSDYRLNNCILISSLKPCKMCREVIRECRISKVYYLLDRKDENFNEENYYQLDFSENKIIKEYKYAFLNFFKKLR